MNTRLNYGFTIVELLIVIVMIAILTAVSTVAYAGIQQRAIASKAASTAIEVYKGFEAYYALEGHYPLTATVDTGREGCIGKISDFPSRDGFGAGECAPDIYSSEMTSVDTALTAEIGKVMTAPNTSLPPLVDLWSPDKQIRGIYFKTGNSAVSGQWLYITYQVRGKQKCPDVTGFYSDYDSTEDITRCRIQTAHK